jgi:hypothetical protein
MAPQRAAQAICDDDVRQMVLCASAVLAVAVTLAGVSGCGTPRRHPADEPRPTVPSTSRRNPRQFPAMSARGRILYDFPVCLRRLRPAVPPGPGARQWQNKVTLSDLRSTTWGGAAKSYIFKSQNYLNETMIDTVDGKAERQAGKVAVSLTKPVDKMFDLEAATVFPTEHMRRITPPREDKSIIQLPVYDGSEKGEKLQHAHRHRPRDRAERARSTDAAAGKAALAAPSWPVTVSYFDKASKSGDRRRSMPSSSDTRTHLACAGARLQRFASAANSPRSGLRHQALQVAAARSIARVSRPSERPTA